jgi:formamidopyrimidine-DNA glycosylase
MPEYPDITVYIEAIERHAVGKRLETTRLQSPFLVRTYQPPLTALHGTTLVRMRRIGKRLAFGFENDHWMVLHLMIAGRLHWKARGVGSRSRQHLAAFDFENGSLTLTEAGTKRQASVHVFATVDGLDSLDPGGLEVMDAPFGEFAKRVTVENHTLKRALTDPHILSGIGNAYSDEILLAARLSPVALTKTLSEAELRRLFDAIQERLRYFTDLLRRQTGDGFPEGVTAFRSEMAAHGKFGEACPACGTPIQRIVYAANETNYCPGCQTGGRLLADRSLSRLLGKDWPKSLEEMELRKRS